MKRTEKILRLVAVGFSATELSRHSNNLLDATYESAKPLMKAKQEEVNRVMARENKHSVRLRQQISDRQRDQAIEANWLRTWKPMPPIRTVGNDVDEIVTMIRDYSDEHDREKELFRKTGHKRHADAANNALQRMRHMRGQLAHLVETVEAQS